MVARPEVTMPISSSPINREVKRPAAGLNPGCKSMPGARRGDDTTSLNNPAPGMKGALDSELEARRELRRGERPDRRRRHQPTVSGDPQRETRTE